MDKKSVLRRNDSIHAHAIKILKQNNSPMTTQEITQQILKEREIKGKTPVRTVSSVLQRSLYVKRIGFSKFEIINFPPS